VEKGKVFSLKRDVKGFIVGETSKKIKFEHHSE
jgi:hypothetical protein